MIAFEKDDGGRRKDYGPGKGRKLAKQGDCVVRAISIALGQGYRDTLGELCVLAIEMGGIPNGERVYETYLAAKGWERQRPLRGGDGAMIRVRDFSLFAELKYGPQAKGWSYLVSTTSHLSAVVDGTLRDTWDCRKKVAGRFYVKEKKR
jgi:hypothetical protein